ncbi:MAG: hypothetical protein N2662_04040 [Bacteroidales bacterium]|nr:hypothetical protein [Bacteroidales bacterium]
MKKKKIVVWAIFVVLCALLAYNLLTKRHTTLSSYDARLSIKDTTSIQQVFILRNKDTLSFSRKSNKTWVINNNRTVNPVLINFCFRIFSQLKISSVVPRTQWNSIRDSILRQGVEVVLTNDNNENVLHLHIYPNRELQKTYALRHGALEPFLVELPGYEGNFAGVFYLPRTQWYQPLIINYLPSQIKEVLVEHVESDKNSFFLRLSEGLKPQLLDSENNPHPYSDEAVKAYLTFFRNIKVEHFIDNKSISDSLSKKNPIYQLRIVDWNDSVNQLNFYAIVQKGLTDKNFCYVSLSNGLVGVIPYYRIDPVIRTIDFFTSMGK